MTTTIIGIGGGSGAGKTTLATALVEQLKGDALLISHDRYYRFMPCGNYDCFEALNTKLMLNHLASLSRGESVELPLYDVVNSTPRTETELVCPHPILVVEGIFVLSIPEIYEQLHLKVYVETSRAMRMERRIVRDSNEKCRKVTDIIDEWHRNVIPCHEALVKSGVSAADLVVSGAEDIHKVVHEIVIKLLHDPSRVAKQSVRAETLG